jgi:pyruvate formate lyase activating enzyme
MHTITVAGLTPLSTVDYPEALAAVVFCQGCPWQCRYCQNAPLQDVQVPGERDWGEVLGWLETRRGLLDAVVFSGGEPTMQPGLGQAMATVADMGFRVGLHSAGMFPEAMGAVLGSCQWLGLDIKGPEASYARITGVEGSGRAAWTSLELALGAGPEVEVRTTWHPLMLGEEDLLRLAQDLAEAGVRHWVVQGFRPQGCQDAELVATGPTAPSPELVERLASVAPEVDITVRT